MKIIYKMHKNQNIFLSKVALTGYKSIVDLTVDFEDNLNIIIGKNSAGKTNLLTFLNYLLTFSHNELTEFKSRLDFSGYKPLTIEAENHIVEDNFINPTQLEKGKTDVSIKIENKIIQDPNPDYLNLLSANNVAFESTFIKHGIPSDYNLIDKPFGFNIDKKGFPSDLLKVILNTETPYFIKCVMSKILFSTYVKNENIKIDTELLKNKIEESFVELDKIRKVLSKYSPIEDIRFNSNFNISQENDFENYYVNNLFVEFNVQGRWYQFSNLSDGTKRLFYIISEIAYVGDFQFFKNGFGKKTENKKRVVLIEEPELGVHPHQLMSLMKFIKEQSNEKQIIVTTHSPIVLDVLNDTELNRIIIASNNNKNGTQLRHLTEAEITKAKLYMQDDYLSDYWKYSDLEN